MVEPVVQLINDELEQRWGFFSLILGGSCRGVLDACIEVDVEDA